MTPLSSRCQFNIQETKTHLSKLLARVEAGEEIVIARAGRPIAKIVAFQGVRNRRKGGFWKGLVTVSDDFYAPMSEEEIAEFETPLEP